MAIINGVYKDKGRGIELKTSILDIRIRSYPYDTDTISLDPTNATFYTDVGEWVLLNASGNLVRPAKSADGTALNLATKAVLAGQVNAVAGPPYCVYADRGAMDVQASGKIPVLMQGQKQGEFGLYVADDGTGAAIGEELCVLFVDGNHAGFTTTTGFTGVKGILVPIGLVESGINAAFTTGAGATALWVVGILTDTTATGSSVVYADLYSTPIKKTITIG